MNHQRRSLFRYGPPLVVIVVSVLVLVGCFPVPSTQQYMSNGKLKPSHSIGDKADDPIRLGYTKLDQAIDVHNQLCAGKSVGNYIIGPMNYERSPDSINATWLRLDDRHYELPYSRRAGFLVFPLCFSSVPMIEGDYVVLTVDAENTVQAFQTLSDLQQFGIAPGASTEKLRLFPPPTLSRRREQPTTRP